MTTFVFEDATREQAKARIGLQGPGGSGKTKSALRLAEGLAAGGLIGLIDTERESAKKYAVVPGKPHLGGHVFKHLPMTVCSPENLIAAVHLAEATGLAVLIVDSWSHFWAGKGGLLERVDQESKKAGHHGGSYTAWAPVNVLEQDMLDALLGFKGHVIVTMRTKNDYEMNGKTVTKVGVKTIQREGAEYEVDVLIDMIKGTGTVTKTRYEPLDDLSVHHPGPELAETILEQLGQGVDPVAVLVDRLAVPVETLGLDEVLDVREVAGRRRLLAAGVLVPETGEPTTLMGLLQSRLAAVTVRHLAAEWLTYDGALALYQRAKAGGWLEVPYTDHESGEMTSLGGLIAARGKGLKPQPQGTPSAGPPATPEAPPAEDQGEPSDEGEQPASQQPAPSGSSGATPPQMRMIHATLADLGIENADRDRRHTALSLILGRRIASANEMTFTDASAVIDTLNRFTGPDATDQFRAHLNERLAAAQS